MISTLVDILHVVWRSLFQKCIDCLTFLNERFSLLFFGAPSEKGPSKQMLSLLEQPIVSSKQRLLLLQELVSEARVSLEAIGVEICLYDKESKSYRQSIVSGTPFSEPIDEMLGGSSGQISILGNVTLVEQLHFAGEAVGVLRASFKKYPLSPQEQALKMYAQYANLTIINSNFITEIQRARRLQEDSLKAKTGFLAGLSHELRGPLGVILNASEVMKDGMTGELTGQQKDLLGMILTNGEHLLELLNDVLDYARVEAGKVAPQKTPIQVAEILKELSNVIQVQAHSKKQKVIVTAHIDAEVLCDRRHFRQVLINLLTNAVKYTPEGGTIELLAERTVGGKIEILVKDTGCGIAPADFGKVFGAFERVTHGYAAEQTGTGLGMPLTKRLVEVNGGSIDFRSEVGEGTVFSVIFQEAIKDLSNNKFLTTIQKKPESTIIGARISFIGYKNPENILLVEYLTKKGCMVEWHLKTLDVKSATRPQVILVDESYSKTYPNESFQSIRKKLESVSLPLMYLSRDAFNYSIEEQLKQGVDRFLAKPVSLEEVLLEISKLSEENHNQHLVH